MPWDFDPRAPFDYAAPDEAETAFYPADRPGWCEAIEGEAPPSLPVRRPGPRALPEPDDLLGWSVLLVIAPALLLGTLLLAVPAALHLF